MHDVGLDHRADRPILVVLALQGGIQLDPGPAGGEPGSQFDIFDAGSSVSTVEASGRSEPVGPHGAAPRPEGVHPSGMGDVGVVVQQVAELACRSGSRRFVVVGSEHRGEIGIGAETAVDPIDRAVPQLDVGVDEEKELRPGGRGREVAGDGGPRTGSGAHDPHVVALEPRRRRRGGTVEDHHQLGRARTGIEFLEHPASASLESTVPRDRRHDHRDLESGRNDTAGLSLALDAQAVVHETASLSTDGTGTIDQNFATCNQSGAAGSQGVLCGLLSGGS